MKTNCNLLTYLIITVLVCSGSAVSSQSIDNVRLEAFEDSVYIFYDLKDLSVDQTANVRVYVPTYGGETFVELAGDVSGDIGFVTSPGSKRIIWYVSEEIDDFVHEKLRFQVSADYSVPKQFYKGFQFQMIPNLGLRSGKFAFGLQAAAMYRINRLGIGARASFYHSIKERNSDPYNYNPIPTILESYCKGYGYNAILSYDLIKRREHSLYPFISIGHQWSYIATFDEGSFRGDYRGYSLGVCYNKKKSKLGRIGVEFECYLPRNYIPVSPNNYPYMIVFTSGGFSLGITLIIGSYK